MLYSFSRTFPREEMFGLTAQFRRAAISIAANIAEGFKKRSIKIKLVSTT
jgi:four helix bundle protein